MIIICEMKTVAYFRVAKDKIFYLLEWLLFDYSLRIKEREGRRIGSCIRTYVNC